MTGPVLRAATLSLLLAGCAAVGGPPDPLPSWNHTGPRREILDFVERVTREGSPDFVPPAERIAVFDNDGTLLAERPVYAQLRFTLDRLRALAPSHPEWAGREDLAPLLAGDEAAFLARGMGGILPALGEAHAGMTTEAFGETARAWLDTARHPETGRPWTGMVYRPMLEVLDYLREKGFRTWIVTGGGVDFVRAFAPGTYGIPPEQVIGTQGALSYEVVDGRPSLVKQGAVQFVDDGPGKPAGIHARIGLRPIAAFGNSDGDLEMLQWTAAGPGARFALLVHHTDAEREWAYDRDSPVGRLDRALDAARAGGWTVVDMKEDWNAVFR